MTKTNSDKQSTYQNGVPPLLREQSSKPIQIGIAVNGLVKALPLHDLAPEEFERLCLRLIEREVDVEAHATLYGRSGQKQHGIDIYTQRHDTREHWVYQCKRYEEYDSSKLNKSVGLFVCNWQVAQGQEPAFVGLPPKKKPSKTVSEETESKEYTPPKWFAEIKRFVICITTDFGNDTDLGNAERDLSKLLEDLGLKLEVWHADVINGKIKPLPEVVEEFFGVNGVQRFCLESVSKPYLKGMQARELLTIARPIWNAKVKTFSPAELLVSRNRIVPFEGRETELENLRTWCEADFSFDVLAYTGAGGTGKTRLLLEL